MEDTTGLETQNEEINVLDESNENVVTFSKEMSINLYNFNNGKYSDLSIPYTTIKIAKKARLSGFRQVNYEVFNRPDQSSHLRSMLDLWGFRSYVDYLYTVCELGFLEGLIPVVDFGFLSPDELRKLHDVVALFRVPLFTETDLIMDSYNIRSLDRAKHVRSLSFEWVNKLGYANSTGFFVYKGQRVSEISELLLLISDIISKYNIVHEVCIYTQSKYKDCSVTSVSLKQMKKIYSEAKSILPDNVRILFPNASYEMQLFLLEEGEVDLGVFYSDILDFDSKQDDINKIKDTLSSDNKIFLQRFPLCKEYIQHERYSKKLGQVFDSYKYRIKKQLLEKQKESK